MKRMVWGWNTPSVVLKEEMAYIERQINKYGLNETVYNDIGTAYSLHILARSPFPHESFNRRRHKSRHIRNLALIISRRNAVREKKKK